MKKIFILFTIYFATIAQVGAENINFDFIKSNETMQNVLYDSTVLLWGGIALISIAFAGVIFTLIPRKKKKSKKKTEKVKLIRSNNKRSGKNNAN